MNKLKLRISGMHCESCEKTLKRAISKVDHVENINLKYSNEIAEITYNPEINLDKLIEVIRGVGYDATPLNGDITEIKNPKFSHYINSLLDKKNEVEGSIIKNALLIFVILLGLETIAYYGFFQNIPNFWSNSGYYIIFLVISVVLSAIAIWHIKSYGDNFSCMTGMMIGMTIGMVSGFLIGLIVGATNGMFIGTIAGIIVGMSVGTWTGKCCGVMGVMEGMMAGLMGGLMGAMTSLMMLNDHLKAIIPILVIASSVILIGLDYLVYKETTGIQIRKINKQSMITFLTYCFVVTMALTWLMVYGPRAILFT